MINTYYCVHYQIQGQKRFFTSFTLVNRYRKPKDWEHNGYLTDIVECATYFVHLNEALEFIRYLICKGDKIK